MATSKISTLTAGVVPTGTGTGLTTFEGVQNGANVKLTDDQIASWVKAWLATSTSTLVLGGWLRVVDNGDLSWGGSNAYINGSHASTYLRVMVNATERVRFNATGIGFNGSTPVAKPTVTGAKGGNAALTSLMSALSALGLVTDSTT